MKNQPKAHRLAYRMWLPTRTWQPTAMIFSIAVAVVFSVGNNPAQAFQFYSPGQAPISGAPTGTVYPGTTIGGCGLIQQPVLHQTRYTFYRRYVQEPRQETAYRIETETQHQTAQVTEYKDETTVETRYRKVVNFVPVVETDYRTERTKKLVPHTETVMENRQRLVTEMVEETGFRETQVIVPKTIQETSMQERSRIVQTPVTQTYQQQVPVTTYQQQTTYRPQLVNNPVTVNQLVVQPGINDRSRLRWLGRTYYNDPLSGRQVFRRSGLYWTRNQNPSTAYISPTVVPNYQVQNVPQTTLVPTTSYQTQTYNVNSTVNRVVTEKVPVTVNRTVNEIVTKKVPYTTRRPVTKTVTEQIPVQRTTMREEITETQVPVKRTVMKRVEKEEPYTVQVTKKVPITRTVDQPRTVTKRVPYTKTRMVSRLAYFRVTLDSFGRPIQGSDVEVDIYGNPLPIQTKSTATPTPVAESQPVIEQSASKPAVSSDEKSVTENSTLSPESSAIRPSSAPRLRALKPVFSGGSEFYQPKLLDLKPIDPVSGSKGNGTESSGRMGT